MPFDDGMETTTEGWKCDVKEDDLNDRIWKQRIVLNFLVDQRIAVVIVGILIHFL